MEFSRTGTIDLLRVRLLVPFRTLVSVKPILSTCDGSNVFIFISAIYFLRKKMDKIDEELHSLVAIAPYASRSG